MAGMVKTWAFGAALTVAVIQGDPASTARAADHPTRPDVLVGSLYAWHALDGWQGGTILFHPDGRVEMTTSIEGLARDDGHWRIVGGALCTRWSRARDGAEKCYRLRQRAPGHYESDGGNVFILREPLV